MQHYPPTLNPGNYLAQLNPNKDALREYWSAYRELCLTMYGTRLATVAGMDGHTLGAGCALALCCDTRVLLKSAKIGLNEAEYGLRIPSWMVDILTNTIGNHHAERACSLGFIFDSGNDKLCLVTFLLYLIS